MNTNSNEQQKNSNKPEMTKMAYDFMANCYIYGAQLRAKGHNSLAERLISQSLELDYEANFVKAAFSTPEFIDHLRNGFYAAAKAMECLRLAAAVDIKCDGHEELVESCDTMRRMLKSSVVTMMNREKEGGSNSSSDSPVVNRFEQQEKQDYVEPHRKTEKPDGEADPGEEEDAVFPESTDEAGADGETAEEVSA